MSIVLAGLNKQIYSDAETWYEFYESGKDLYSVVYHPSWFIMLTKLRSHPKFESLNNTLKKLAKNKTLKIHPSPQYTFASLLATHADNVSVVFIGQDPYFNSEYYKGKHVSQATGLSFSVADDFKLPSSLQNIFANMQKYGHITKTPQSGNLWYWAVQGCLMLNAALTVEDGVKESHLKMWEWFTDQIIQYISLHYEGVVFVLWGAYAYKKMTLIDQDKHKTVVSSHPSGLSANTPFRQYPAFMNRDHFKEINDYLTCVGKKRILWE